MNARTKATIVILATLIIGMVLGAALHSFYARNQFGNVLRFRASGYLKQHLMETIQPDSSQQEIVSEIFAKRFNRMSETREEGFRKFRAQLDSLQLELQPHLTPEQIRLLAQKLSSFPSGLLPPRQD